MRLEIEAAPRGDKEIEVLLLPSAVRALLVEERAGSHPAYWREERYGTVQCWYNCIVCTAMTLSFLKISYEYIY